MNNQSRFLNNLLGDRLSRSRKPKTKVKFCEYKAEQLPHTKLVGDTPAWEWVMREATEEIVFNLLNEQVEYGEKISRPWTGDVDLWDLPQNQSEERKSTPAKLNVGLDDTERLFQNSSLPGRLDEYAEWGESMDVKYLFDTMVMPMACAFVHKTDWRWSLKRFARDSETWLEMVRGLAGDFCEGNGMASFISNLKFHNWWTLPQGDSIGGFTNSVVRANVKEFWNGYKESKKVHAKQFYFTLVYYTRRMCQIIKELEEDFPEDNVPCCFEFVLSSRVWEQMVLDWTIDSEGREAYVFFYGTEGEFLYLKEYAKNAWGMNGLDGCF